MGGGGGGGAVHRWGDSVESLSQAAVVSKSSYDRSYLVHVYSVLHVVKERCSSALKCIVFL